MADMDYNIHIQNYVFISVEAPDTRVLLVSLERDTDIMRMQMGNRVIDFRLIKLFPC